MMKKLLSLSALFLCSLVAFAQEFSVDGINYEVTSEEYLRIELKSGGSCTGDIVIPEKVTYKGKEYCVFSVGDGAFSGCIDMTSVIIPNTVEYIGIGAFSGCTGLTSVSIGNTVSFIAESAFQGCSGLTSVTIPNSVYRILWYAFLGCSSLTSVTIGNKVDYIGTDAFSGCTSLTSIKVESGNTKYDSRDNCNAIIETESNTLIWGCKNTTIPNSVTSIGSWAFSGCSGLSSVTIPNSVTSIGDNAFKDCVGLISLTIPNSVKSMGNWSFMNFVNLASVTLPDCVTSIESSAFEGCSSLTSVTIPNSVTSIGYDAFKGCSSLTSVTIPNSVTSIKHSAFYDCVNLAFVDINCSEIGQWFKANASIKEIVIGDDVTSIGESAFAHCSGLTSVSIGNSLTSIGNSAFLDCSGLTSVTIPNSVTSIGDHAFWCCSSLTSLIIGNSVKDIGSDAFSGCSGLFSITVKNENPYYDSRDNCNALIETTSNTIIVGSNNSFIPNTVTSIGDNAFNGCSGLTSVTIPNSVVSIGDYAFYKCGGLTSVTIGNSVTSIGYYAFYGCSSLNSLTIGNSVTSIEKWAFSGCSLTSVIIPNSVTSIGDYAFWGCIGLKEVISLIEEPFKISIGVFRKSIDGVLVFTEATLYVPVGTKEKYKAMSAWNEFKNIVEMGASSGIAIDETNFPDENFRKWVLDQDYGQDGVLTEEEIAGVKEIYVSRQNISSLKGIEYFTELTELYCNGNQLTSLDMSENTLLKCLICDYNSLTSLNVTKCTALVNLDCESNQLTALDITKNTALTDLTCGENLLTSLDVSMNINLKDFDCSNNQLTSLNVSNNKVLSDFVCYKNKIYGAAMDALIESLPIVNSDFVPISPFDSDEQNVITKTQVAAAQLKGWKTWYIDEHGKWQKYEGSEPEMEPIDNGETIDLGTEIDENTNLEGTVVDNVFVNISNGDGGFDPVEGCLIVSKPTDDSTINGKDIFGDDFKDNYTGIVFKVNEGKGSIKVEAETQGNMVLKVKIGNSEPIEMELDGKLKVKFPYDVSEETLVYIYGGLSSAGAKATGARRAPSATDLLKIYGFEIVSDPSGIDAIENGQQQDAPVYNLNGQRVNTPSKGVYIKNGRKVIVK